MLWCSNNFVFFPLCHTQFNDNWNKHKFHPHFFEGSIFGTKSDPFLDCIFWRAYLKCKNSNQFIHSNTICEIELNIKSFFIQKWCFKHIFTDKFSLWENVLLEQVQTIHRFTFNKLTSITHNVYSVNWVRRGRENGTTNSSNQIKCQKFWDIILHSLANFQKTSE